MTAKTKVFTSKQLNVIAPMGVSADFCKIRVRDGELIHTFTDLELAKTWLFVPESAMAMPGPSYATNASGKNWEVYTTSGNGVHKYLYVLNTPVNGIVAWGGYNPEDVNF